LQNWVKFNNQFLLKKMWLSDLRTSWRSANLL